MTPRQKIDGNPNFTFVTNPGNDPQEHQRQSRQQARSHTARIIRRRQRGENAKSSPAFCSNLTRQTSPWPTPACTASSAASSPHTQSSHNSPEEAAERLAVTLARERVPRCVSPVFGALTTNGFDGTNAEAATYCLNIDRPNLLTPEEASAWFQVFCKEPVIFHGFNHASATLQDILRNQISRSNRRDMLTHKSEAFRLMGELVARLDDHNVELILFAVMIMWHYDLKDDEIRETGVLPVSPHMPGANWLGVYGRTQGVEAHVRPLFELLKKAGGIRNLKMPGLAFAISCGDLVAASIAFQRPSLPNYWPRCPSVTDMFDMLHVPTTALSGTGFLTSVRGRLPSDAEFALLQLCAVDTLLDRTRQRRLTDAQQRMLVDARNAAQHGLLSLPPWQELDSKEQEGRFLATYESCRITAALYSNAIIFPLPLNTGWHRRLIAKLKGILECSNMTSWQIDVSEMPIWCLFVGGIASFRTSDRSWFENALRLASCRANLTNYHDVEQILTSFCGPEKRAESELPSSGIRLVFKGQADPEGRRR